MDLTEIIKKTGVDMVIELANNTYAVHYRVEKCVNGAFAQWDIFIDDEHRATLQTTKDPELSLLMPYTFVRHNAPKTKFYHDPIIHYVFSNQSVTTIERFINKHNS